MLSSGLGGVYPKGIPIGTVTGVVREQAGWERVYRLLPAANPGSVTHVLVLVSASKSSLEQAFPSDSALEAQRLDSLAAIRRRGLGRGRPGAPGRFARRSQGAPCRRAPDAAGQGAASGGPARRPDSTAARADSAR